MGNRSWTQGLFIFPPASQIPHPTPPASHLCLSLHPPAAHTPHVAILRLGVLIIPPFYVGAKPNILGDCYVFFSYFLMSQSLWLFNHPSPTCEWLARSRGPFLSLETQMRLALRRAGVDGLPPTSPRAWALARDTGSGPPAGPECLPLW